MFLSSAMTYVPQMAVLFRLGATRLRAQSAKPAHSDSEADEIHSARDSPHFEGHSIYPVPPIPGIRRSSRFHCDKAATAGLSLEDMSY